MSSQEYRFIEPLDVLFLRGNRLFGEAGSFGESQMPPNPSVIAGALRSRMLVDDGIDPTAFARGEVQHPQLGTPKQPGPFGLASLLLARGSPASADAIEALYPPPADLVIQREGTGAQAVLTVKSLHPSALAAGIGSSTGLPRIPILAQDQRGKPVGGYWLDSDGWKDYLAGNTPRPSQLVESSQLWALEDRVGVGLNAGTRSVEEGRLFSSQAIVPKPRVGFLASIVGATPPSAGLLRLGGDGRGAAIRTACFEPVEADMDAIARAGRCRLILTSPGIFDGGWKPPAIDENDHLSKEGLSAQLVAAAVPRHQVISGWDLASQGPKPAHRVAPAGSVYWLADLTATPETLRQWVAQGLWSVGQEKDSRRAEGYNRFTLAAW